AEITVNNSQFLSNNSGVFGGGVYVQALTGGNINLSSNLVSGNTSQGGDGGASIFVQTGSATCVDRIFFDNHSLGGPVGGVDMEFLDIPPPGGSLTFVNNTVIGNSTSATSGPGGGGLFLEFAESGETMNVYNNIVFGNTTAGATGNDIFVEDIAPTP